MQNIYFKTITDVTEARNLWDYFSENKTLDDSWDFRYIFHKHLRVPLHFITAYDNDTPVALLPLQRNNNKGMSQRRFGAKEPFLEFFGGIDTDNNKIFVKPGYEFLSEKLLKQITMTTILAPLGTPVNLGMTEAIHYTDKFVMSFDAITDFEAFLQTRFNGKSRQRLKNRLNHFTNNFTLEIKEGTESDLELLFAFSKDRFGESSSFNMSHRRKIMHDLCTTFKTDIFVIYLNGEPKAVSFALMHNGTYDGINIGYDYSVDDLGKLVFASQIQRAINFGCKMYDVGKNANGWKEHFHLDKQPQYKLSIYIPQTFQMASA